MLLQLLADLLLPTNQDHLNIVMTTGEDRPFHLGPGGPVSTHCVDSNDCWHGQKCGSVSKPPAFVGLTSFLYFKDFTSFIVPTLGTGPMWHLFLVTIRTLGKRVGGEKIVRAASRSSCFRMPPFRIRHK